MGWDAADWKSIMPLIERGKMPNLARMMDEGVASNLATLQPCFSPMLWTSIATGKRAYKHGILGFTELDPESGSVRPITNLSRSTKAIWNIFNQAGKNTITVGWWPSHPPEPLSRGIMISNRYQRTENAPTREDWSLPDGCVHPVRLTGVLEQVHFHPADLHENELAHFVPAITAMNLEEKKALVKRPQIQALMKIIADCTSINSAATALMQNEPWDFMAVYFDAIDHFGHGFMKYHPPKLDHVSEEEFRLFSNINDAGYEYHDMMLGSLLALAGDDCNVILISDHGFHPDEARLKYIPREHAGPAREHREFGIFAAKGPDFKRGQNVIGASLLDICPTILHLHDLAVGDDMDGRVLSEIMADPREPQRIPSWDEVEGDDGCHSAETKLDEVVDEEALAQLVALGYLEKANDGQEKAAERTRCEHQLNLATSYIDAGIIGEAIDLLEPLYEQFPSQHQIGFKLASCYQRLNRIHSLKNLSAKLLKNRLEEKEEAEREVEELKRNEEESITSGKDPMDGKTAQEKQAYQRRLRLLYQKIRPNLYSYQHLAAYVDFAEGRYEGVIEKTNHLDQDLGARATSLRLRAMALTRLKRYEDAMRALDQAAEIEPESAENSLFMARNYLRAKKLHKAREAAEQSIALRFQNPRAHYLRGYILASLGDLEEAKNALRVCIKQAPNSPTAYRLFASLLRRFESDHAQAGLLVQHARELRKKALLAKRKNRRSLKKEQSETRELQQRIPIDESALNDLARLDDREVITVVSGLPRSGTSLMMQVLEQLGIEPFTDKVRTPDDSNPRGYYEHQKILDLDKRTRKNWLLEARGKSLKVVAPLLPHLPMQVIDEKGHKVTLNYRVILMERPMDELINSQERMISRLESGPNIKDRSRLAQNLRAYENRARRWCQRGQIPAIGLSLYEFVNGSQDETKKLQTLLSRSLDRDGFEKVFDKDLLHVAGEESSHIS